MHSDWSCTVLDVETTGLDPAVDRVVSYCFRTWSLDNGKGAERSALILPPDAALFETTDVARLIGFTQERWLAGGAHLFWYQHIDEIAYMLQDAKIVGCYPEFDLRMLEAEFTRMGVPFPKVRKRINICDLAAPLLVIGEIKSASLESLANYFGCNRAGAHTATGDVDTTIEVWESLLRAYLVKE